MNIKFIILFIIFIYCDLFSQGFNWQYSSRLPFESPKFFIGVAGSYSNANSSGEFPFVEDRFTCCEFNEGSGYSIELGIGSEYWIKPNTAIRGNINYSPFVSDFSSIKEYPVILNGDLIYNEQFEYIFETAQHLININLGYKYKFISHFSLIGSINIDYLFYENNNSSESRIGPVDRVQPYTRFIPEGTIKGIRNLYLAPEIAFAYDLELGKGIYSTIEITAELPLMSYSSAAEWQLWQIGIGAAIYRGILFK